MNDLSNRFCRGCFSGCCVVALLTMALSHLGCTRQVLYTAVLDYPPSNLATPSRSAVVSSKFHRVMAADSDTTWSKLMRILVRTYIIVKVAEKEHLVSFVEIDGFYYDDKLYFAEFPMAACLDAYTDSSTAVYALPIAKPHHLPEKRALRDSYLEAQDVKVIEFLNRVSSEIEGSVRWPWLWENTSKP